MKEYQHREGNSKPTVNTTEKSNNSSFNRNNFNKIFNFESFFRKVLKRWYLIVLGIFVGYAIAWYINKYVENKVFQTEIVLSVSSSTSSVLAPSNSVIFNYGGGGNKEGLFIKKLLLSRTHNEELVKRLNLFTKYFETGKYKTSPTYIDESDSPYRVEIDTAEAQPINLDFEIVFDTADSFIITIPEDQNGQCYDFNKEINVGKCEPFKYYRKLHKDKF